MTHDTSVGSRNSGTTEQQERSNLSLRITPAPHLLLPSPTKLRPNPGIRSWSKSLRLLSGRNAKLYPCAIHCVLLCGRQPSPVGVLHPGK